MRLYRYLSKRGGLQPRLAIAPGDGSPIDLLDAWRRYRQEDVSLDTGGFLVSVGLLLEEGPDAWGAVAHVAEQASSDADLVVEEGKDDLHWLCPFDRMASLKDFLAFEDHVKRGAQRRGGEVPPYWYEAPIYYKGNHRALLGPDEECRWPEYTDRLDFELELAMVIGTRGRDLDRENASKHIFGFTVFNDFSARDIQAKEISAWLGPAKGKDFANSFGPCIVTVDEVGAEPDLQMICRVNEDEWGRARSSDMKWKWSEMIAHVSMSEDVFPGDVFGSGTPGGCCGLDQGRELKPGDVVELEIEKIGTLRNTLGSKSS
jgi:2-keto-4-pentenoate hydratase/2-oxohepta-3-ene-1,7-dioic acid hydratase in catechol pathway